MKSKKVSLCFMTLDRYEKTVATLNNNLKNHGFGGEIELLWCDNGSKDSRFEELFERFKPKYLRRNKSNEGCAKGFNQLMIRSTGDYIVLMGNDVLMPDNWLAEMVKYADFVPNSGFIGIKCTAEIPTLDFKFDCFAHFLNDKCDKVFGVTLFRREVLETIGGFCDDFDVYGLEDSNFNDRVNLHGFNSLYVPASHFLSTHVGDDVGNKDEYRLMKDKSLENNLKLFWSLREQYKNGTRSIKEPLPPLRKPIE